MTHRPSLNSILTATAVVTMGVAAICTVPAWSSADESQRDAGTSAAPGSDLLVSARGGGGRGGGGRGGGARAGGGGHNYGGGGRGVRSGASSSVNHRANANRNVNRNTNRNVNRNTNVNVNGNGNCCGGGWDNGWDDHPFATGAAIAAGAAVVGSMVNSVPSNCGTVNVNGYDYYQCGNTWYQPQYQGSSVQYAVVSPPQ